LVKKQNRLAGMVATSVQDNDKAVRSGHPNFHRKQ